MTTVAEISGWFDRGVAAGATHMLVVCDTFDWGNYPVYAESAAECVKKACRPGEMQKVMEVYDLTADKDEQLAERRCNRLPETSNAD